MMAKIKAKLKKLKSKRRIKVSKPDTMMIDDVKYVRADKSEEKEMAGDYVIVRAHTAGVHAGYMQSRTGDTIILNKSRRLWQWSGASLSQVATSGLANGTNKIGAEVPKTEIVSPQGFEILFCTKEAKKNIEGFSPWLVK